MNIKETTLNARQWLKQHGYPYSDQIPLKKSPGKFNNGALFGIEIPVINSLETLEHTLNYLDQYNIRCDRFNETRGAFLLPQQEISDMLALCHDNNTGIFFSLGPRPEYDIKSTFYRTSFGMEQARRLNNHDAIAASVDEALRLADLGCRGLIVYDVGVLHILSHMRTIGDLPKNMMFKTSSHCMASNPIIVKLLQEQGANSVTMLHDSSLVVLQEARRLCPNLVLDIPIDVYKSKGGFIRFYELVEMIEIAAPIILKLGASAQAHPYDQVTQSMIKERVKKVAVALEFIERKFSIEQAIPDRYKGLPALEKDIICDGI
jgi:hypothetical protein